MRMSPVDMRRHEFRRGFRGYNVDEVRAFAELAADQTDDLLRTSEELKQEVAEIKARVEEYARMEETLRSALMTAERAGNESRANAEREATLIIREAEVRAEAIKEEAERRAQQVADEIGSLQEAHDAYLLHMRSLVETQMRLLDMHEGNLPPRPVFKKAQDEESPSPSPGVGPSEEASLRLEEWRGEADVEIPQPPKSPSQEEPEGMEVDSEGLDRM